MINRKAHSNDAKYDEVFSSEAWEALATIEKSFLVDVRTIPEWSFVGLPNLKPLGKETQLIAWRNYPTMTINENFINQLEEIVKPEDAEVIYFVCRSGARSAEAAKCALQHGYGKCINVLHGFEGEVNDEGKRGLVNGWKAEQLPWFQQ